MKSLCDEILHPRWNLPLAGCGIVGANIGFLQCFIWNCLQFRDSFRHCFAVPPPSKMEAKRLEKAYISKAPSERELLPKATEGECERERLLPSLLCSATSLKDGGYYFPPQWSEARNHDAEHQFMTRQCQIMERSENSFTTGAHLPPQRHAVSYHATCCISRRQSLHITTHCVNSWSEAISFTAGVAQVYKRKKKRHSDECLFCDYSSSYLDAFAL